LPAVLRVMSTVDAVAVAVGHDPAASLGTLRLVESQNGNRIAGTVAGTAGARP
jgi:hypothetical protein